MCLYKIKKKNQYSKTSLQHALAHGRTFLCYLCWYRLISARNITCVCIYERTRRRTPRVYLSGGYKSMLPHSPLRFYRRVNSNRSRLKTPINGTAQAKSATTACRMIDRTRRGAERRRGSEMLIRVDESQCFRHHGTAFPRAIFFPPSVRRILFPNTSLLKTNQLHARA